MNKVIYLIWISICINLSCKMLFSYQLEFARLSAMILKLKESKKREKKQTLLKKCLKGAAKKYIDKVHHRDIFDSAACLIFFTQIDNKLRQITSISGRKEELKDKIRTIVLGLGWDNWNHPWYVSGHEFTIE